MITCDLCGEAKDCLQKQIEGKESISAQDAGSRWNRNFGGKGRVRKEMVFLPPPAEKEQEDEEKPGPGEPPKIWGKGQPN